MSEEIRTYFGKSARPWQNSYSLRGRKIEIKENILIVTCDRCNDFKQEIKRFKIHPDGAITFWFSCMNCSWNYSIYRNDYADMDKVEKALCK